MAFEGKNLFVNCLHDGTESALPQHFALGIIFHDSMPECSRSENLRLGAHQNSVSFRFRQVARFDS